MSVESPLGHAAQFARPAPRTVLVIGGFAWSLVNFRLDLMCRMVANGHRVIAAAPDIDLGTATVLRDAGIEPVSVPMQRTGLNPLNDIRTTKALYRLIRARNPDMIVPYTMKPIVYGALAARIAGNVPCYPLFTGLGYAFSEETPTGRRRAVRAVAILLHRFALRATELGFYYNAAELNDLRRFRMIPGGARMVAVPGSGADTARFVPSNMPPVSPVVFLFIGRMLRSKGLEDLRSAARRLREEGCQFRLELLGPIDSNPDGVDEASLRRWQANDELVWHGATHDVRPYLANCHVLVLPSRLREGVPRSILEAMACGRPVITTDAPGCGETVMDGEAGFVVPVGDSAALASAMRRFINDPRLALQLGANARKRVCCNNDVHLVNRLLLTEIGLELPDHPPRFDGGAPVSLSPQFVSVGRATLALGDMP